MLGNPSGILPSNKESAQNPEPSEGFGGSNKQRKIIMEWWEAFKEWFLSLGENYGVNPFIFGGIYVGAIPFFILSLGWTIKNIRHKKSFVLPALLTGLFFISAYLYLIIAGKNIPAWVYGIIGLMVVYGVYSTFNKIKGKTKNEA